MKAIVFAGAKIDDYTFYEKYLEGCCFVVCCDSGMLHARKMNIIPNVIVGDFDSVDDETFSFFKGKHIKTISLPTHKNETDLEIGLDVVIDAGFKEVIIFGAIGSRMDHTMASCNYLLYLLKKGISAKIINENNEILLIDKCCTIKGMVGQLVSTIPLSMEVRGIYTSGLEYPLVNATLTIDDRLIAVSNVMIEEEAEIKISEGYLLVMKCSD